MDGERGYDRVLSICAASHRGQSYASLPLFFSLTRSPQPRSLLPCPKTLCQPSREQLSLCSTASSISAISLALSPSSQQASNNSLLPFCLSLPSARPIGRFSQLPSPRSHGGNISATRGVGGGVRNHRKTGSVKRHEVWRRNAVWKRSADEQ